MKIQSFKRVRIELTKIIITEVIIMTISKNNQLFLNINAAVICISYIAIITFLLF